MLEIGAARADITPRSPCRLAGYAARNHPHEGIHDELAMRALFARGREGKEAVVVSADILWFGSRAAGEIREALEEKMRIPPERIFLAGTHTHSAPWPNRAEERDSPDGNEEWMKTLIGQTLSACALARAAARPASLSWGRGESSIGVNRRERRPDGRIILGTNTKGPADHAVISLLAEDANGKPVARLANYACHGVVLGQENYQVSGDWPGAAMRMVEERARIPALFLNGGAGNINPRIGPQNDFEPVQELAAEFVGDLLRIPTAKANGDDTVAGIVRETGLPRKQGEREIALRGLRLGPVRLVGYPGEMFSETSSAVRKSCGARPVLVCAYADGGDSGYVPVKRAYRSGGYEVETSPYTAAAEAYLRRGLIELAEGLKRIGS